MLGMFRFTSLTLLVYYVYRNVRFWTCCKKGGGVVVFNFLKFLNFEKLKEEIFNCTILRNRFVRSWRLFCVRNSYYVKNLIAIQIQSCIKLECCIHTCPNGSRFNFCGRIKLGPAEQLVIVHSYVVLLYHCPSLGGGSWSD